MSGGSREGAWWLAVGATMGNGDGGRIHHHHYSRSITTATTITTLTTTCLPSSVFPIQEKVGWWGNMTSMDGGESISQQNQLTREWQEYTTIELLE